MEKQWMQNQWFGFMFTIVLLFSVIHNVNSSQILKGTPLEVTGEMVTIRGDPTGDYTIFVPDTCSEGLRGLPNDHWDDCAWRSNEGNTERLNL